MEILENVVVTHSPKSNLNDAPTFFCSGTIFREAHILHDTIFTRILIFYHILSYLIIFDHI